MREIASFFESSPPVVKADNWSRVSVDGGGRGFQRRVQFEGSEAAVIAADTDAHGGAGQRSLYREVVEMRKKGTFPELSTAFGLTALDNGKNSFRKYLIGNDGTNLFCTYEGIGAPYPFIRCSWSNGPAPYSVLASPIGIHYALSNRAEIEQLWRIK